MNQTTARPPAAPSPQGGGRAGEKRQRPTTRMEAETNVKPCYATVSSDLRQRIDDTALCSVSFLYEATSRGGYKGANLDIAAGHPVDSLVACAVHSASGPAIMRDRLRQPTLHCGVKMRPHRLGAPVVACAVHSASGPAVMRNRLGQPTLHYKMRPLHRVHSCRSLGVEHVSVPSAWKTWEHGIVTDSAPPGYIPWPGQF